MQYVCDSMLGRLARWLRLMGMDAPVVEKPPHIIMEEQILLTRRRDLMTRPRVFFVEHDRLEAQLRQVVKGLGISPEPDLMFTRCLECNRLVEPVSRARVEGLVPEHTWYTAESFSQCPKCKKVFWPGSHRERAESLLGWFMRNDD